MTKGLSVPVISNNTDLLMAFGVIGVLAVMIIPLPPTLLDILLAFNITLSLIILLIAMYTLKPLEFSVFPTVLLVTTLFRLSLNVASTRLILLRGDEGVRAAGEVIMAFGSFVVGGNYAVGIVVFFILVVINFVVITKGAGRIAEVAARFTLDGMPGKQMSIDADLNAGLIDEAGARQRRKAIEEEADFYGSMDGASKFVRGDAIAGVLITFINIFGGFFIGVLQKGMSIFTAAQTYTILTIGDGLVAQIPALLISTAAGIVVTRAASESNLGNDIVNQILIHPKAIGIAASILLIFGLVPGLPKIPFMLLATLAGTIAYTRLRAEKQIAAQQSEEVREQSPEKVESLLLVDPLGLEVGYGLIPFVDIDQGGELLERIKSIRRQLALEMGFIVPPMHIRDNLQLKPGGYSFLVKGIEAAKGELMLNHYLAMNPGTAEEQLSGIETKEPVFGLPALWIHERDKEKAQWAGYTVVELPTVITTHLSEVIKNHVHELLGRQEVQSLLDALSETHPKVVEEIVPKLVPLGIVQKVLQNLLRERIPIRDILSILEALADYSPYTKDVDILTEYARQKLARSISKLYQSPEGVIHLMTLDPKIEEILASAIQRTDQGSYLALDPKIAQKILSKIHASIEKFVGKGLQSLILTSPAVRVHLKRLTERFIPSLIVISYNDIDPKVDIQSLGAVSLSDAD